MRTFRSHARLLAATTFLAVAPAGLASAQAIEGALDRLKALVADQGATIEWGSTQESGSDVTLVDVKVGAEGETVPIGDIVLTGVEESDTGYYVDSITMDHYHVDDGAGSQVTVEGVSLTGVTLPNEGEQDALGGFVFYETADLASLVVHGQGKDIFTLTDLHIEVTAPEDGNPMEFEGAAEGFTIDLSVIEDPQQVAVLTQLGYLQLAGFFEMAGSWQPEDGRMALSQYDLSIVDAGTIGMSFDLGGYTPDFIAALREMQKEMAANPGQDSSEQGLAMLGLMQQLSFHGAEIAFTDDSLTNKVVDFVAQMQGMSAADIKNQAKAVLPFALAQLNNPELTTMATQAVSTFLDDPKSISITAEPAEPVPFALIAAGAMSAPQDLTKTLAVKVYANQ